MSSTSSQASPSTQVTTYLKIYYKKSELVTFIMYSFHSTLRSFYTVCIFCSGVYSCDFEALNTPSSNTSVLTSNVTLRVISESLVSEPLVIPFLPAIFLPLKELVLSDKLTWTMLPVVGIPQVLLQVQVCFFCC